MPMAEIRVNLGSGTSLPSASTLLELCTLDAVKPVNPEDNWTLEPGSLPSLCPGFSVLASLLRMGDTGWVPRRGQESSDKRQAHRCLRTAQMQTHGLEWSHRRDEPSEARSLPGAVEPKAPSCGCCKGSGFDPHG